MSCVGWYVSLLALGSKPSYRACTLACSGVTSATVVALAHLMAPWPVLPRTTWSIAVEALEPWWTQALSGVPAAWIRPTLALFLAPSTECSWRTGVSTGIPSEARQTVTLAGLGVASGAVLTLT